MPPAARDEGLVSDNAATATIRLAVRIPLGEPDRGVSIGLPAAASLRPGLEITAAAGESRARLVLLKKGHDLVA